MIRYTKTKLNLFNHYFTHVIGNCIKPNFRPRDKRGTNNNTTRDKLCPLHFSMLFREWSYCFFLLVCKTMAFGVSEIIQNLTLHPRDEERQSKIIARDKPCLLQFNTFFWEVVLLFFFLLVCEILSPVCPPKIFFKNLHIDIQCFIQHKYRLRGQINILHRQKQEGRYKNVIINRERSAPRPFREGYLGKGPRYRRRHIPRISDPRIRCCNRQKKIHRKI